MKVKCETDTAGVLSREHNYLGEFKSSDVLTKGHLNHGKIPKHTKGTSNTLDQSAGNIPKDTDEKY